MRLSTMVVGLFMMLALSSAASAIVIEGANINTSQIIENSAVRTPADWIAREQSAQVRIPISITNYDTVSVRGTNNQVTDKSVALRPVVKTLRARLDRSNHFHLKDYHVETIPMKWVRNTNMLTMKVNFFKKYGEYNQLEESVGSMILAGKLVGANKLFVFHGSAKIAVNNKEGQPVSEIIAGYGPVNQAQPVAKSKTGKSTL